MTQEIKVDAIQFIDEFYPRGRFDQETVNRYRQAIDRLPPIQITHENILIDGYHRLIAHRIEQRETIRIEVEELNRDNVLWEATRRNAEHGLQLSLADKRKLAKLFFGDSRTNAQIADALSVSESSISRWVRDLKIEKDKERDEQIWQMWLACHTHDEIAKTVNLKRPRITQIIDDVRKLHLQEISTPDSLQIFNLWSFQKADDRYGMDYPGRIPGQIIENVLYYYTEPFDTIVDPMAGGGTTLDVCKAMDRRYRCYDLSPVRDDIKNHDITDGFPTECDGCDLIFLDPPYWKQKKGDYSDGRTNLANFSLMEFYDRIKVIFNGAKQTLAPGGYLAVIIGPTQETGKIYDHAFIVQQMLNGKMEFVNRIIVPYTTQQAKPYHVTDAKDGRYMLKLYRDLLIYRKERLEMSSDKNIRTKEPPT